VTGASKGIGRAIAVELARWEIPLILVARDLTKLTALANELEACYGVDCHVLSADLSQPGVVERIYRTTNDAHMRVDILVNNAGVCTRGEMMESEGVHIRRMIDVNVGAVTALSHLYGKDMKARRRGRILFVSSIVGAAPGGPGVAAYSASKAYEKSLALSIGKELERFGVGVTCIMPGAVKGTAFAAESDMEHSVCWKIPFYPMTAPSIASRSVRALLAGDAEIIPGWHNRSFLKIAAPMLPQRLTTMVVGFFFSPFNQAIRLPWATPSNEQNERLANNSNTNVRNKRMPPRLLTLPKSEEQVTSDRYTQGRLPKLVEESTSDQLQPQEIAIDGKGGTSTDELQHTEFERKEGMLNDELQPEEVDERIDIEQDEEDSSLFTQ